MRCVTFRALVAQAFFWLAQSAAAASSTTTTTITSITTVLTTTVTVTAGGNLTVVPTAVTFTEQIIGSSTTIVGGPQATAWMAGNASWSGEAFQNQVLNSTNYFRAQHGASPLTWNTTLATYAQDYAQKCQWQHSVSHIQHAFT